MKVKKFVIIVEHEQSAPEAPPEQVALATRAMNALLPQTSRPMEDGAFVYKAFTMGMTLTEAQATLYVIEKLAPLMCQEALIEVDYEPRTHTTRTALTIYYRHAPKGTQALVNAMSGTPDAPEPYANQRRMRFNKH